MKKLTNKEKEIMDLYWQHGAMFVRELQEHYAEPRPHFNTLSTIVRILEREGYLAHKQFGNSYQYYPLVSEKEYGRSSIAGVIKNYFNDFYARDTSKKIRAVIHSKGERGERISTTVPYGYMRSPDNPKDWIPDPETAPIVTEIFDLYASGIGIRKICHLLYERKVECPGVYEFNLNP